ncbi:TonB-dependent receptor [Chromatiaceae bacterium AAb-1]|nr:TonB-dependent receptor [Chromatiaceae bacterium AAb-1]
MADETSPEVIVISASQSAEPWLTSPATIEQQLAPEHGILIDSARLFDNISGLQADSRANFAQDTRLTLRGFGSRSAFGIRGLYLQQDGIPLLTPDGQGQLSSVLLDQIASIEVLKGPLAALYGNSSGGVISLYSKASTSTASSIQTAWHQQHQQYIVSSDWVSEQHSLQLMAKQFTTDGFRPHSAAKKQQAGLNWQTTTASDLQLNVRLDWAYDPYLQDPSGLTPEQWQQDPEQTASASMLFDTEKSSWQRQLSISLAQNTAAHSWQLAAWHGNRKINQRLAFTGEAISSAGGEVVLDRLYRGLNGSYRYAIHPALQATIGGSLVSSTDQRQGYVNDFGQRGALRRDEENQASNADAFVRLNWQWHPDWQLHTGIRHSRVTLRIEDAFITEGNPDDSGKKAFNENAIAAGISYRLSEQLSWFASAGTGFETPTLAEIAYRSDGNGPNLDLNVTTNRQWETGLKLLTANAQFSSSIFQINTENELVTDSSLGGRTSYRNAAQTRRQGAELQVQWQHNAAFEQQFSAHYINATYRTEPADGKHLPGIARYQLNWALNYYPLQHPAMLLQLRSHYRARIATDDSNQIYAPSAVNFDVSARWQQYWQLWQLAQWLEITNLADRDQVGSVIVNQANGRSFEPAAPRQLSAGISVRYQW